LATVDLSPGAYVVHGRATTDGAGDCRLQLGGDIHSSETAADLSDANIGLDRSFLVAGSLAQAGQATLFCFGRQGGSTASAVKVVAVKVGHGS
jgi:hypothetical protein